MSILLALASAAAPAAGSNIGGAFLGAQAGVVYNRIKFKAKENAISKDDASAVYDAVVAALKRATLVNASNDASTKDFTDASEGLSKDGKTFTVKYNATNDADAKATHDYVAKTLEAAFSSGKLTKDTGLNIVVTKNKSSSSTADATTCSISC